MAEEDKEKKGKSNLKKAKKVLKYTTLISKVPFIAILIFIILIVFVFPAFFYGTVKETIKKVGDIFKDVSDNIEIDGNNLKINEGYFEDAKKKLKEYGIEEEDLGLEGDKDYLERFLEAEIVTNFPYLGGEKLQGAVYFERYKSDGNVNELTYVEYNEFYELVENGDTEKLSKSFTIDTESWVVHVLKNSENGSNEIEKINYKNMVSKYAMPFEFPATLALSTQNPQFALALVNLVKNSKIVIGIMESKTEKYTTITTEYDEETKTHMNTTNEETSLFNVHRKENKELPVETSYMTNVGLVRANTWILNEVTNLTYKDESIEDQPIVEELPDEYVGGQSDPMMSIEIYHRNKTKTTNVTNYFYRWNRGKIEVIDKSQNFINLILRKTTAISGNGFLQIAKNCHDYLADNEYWYPTAANLSAGKYVSDEGSAQKHKYPEEGEPENQRYVDCSAYVSWVLLKAGYDMGGVLSSSNSSLGAYGKEKGWEIIESTDDLKPGDICFWGGNLNGQDPYHVNIFVEESEGSHYFYDCGSTNSIRSKDPIAYSLSNFGYAFRLNDEVAQSLNPQDTEDLEEKLKNYISGLDNGKYSIAVKDLDRYKGTVTINNDKINSEGLLKIFIMMGAYKEVRNDTIKEDEIKTDIERMITTDSNDSANTIFKKIGEAYLNKDENEKLEEDMSSDEAEENFEENQTQEEESVEKGIKVINKNIKSMGYSQTRIKSKLSENIEGEQIEGEQVEKSNNYTTVSDVRKALTDIYKGNSRAFFKENCDEMLKMLQRQIYVDIIPSTIEGGTVANKTGEQKDEVDDAAIISIDNANYILVVSATDVKDKEQAKEEIREISRIVFSYFLENGKLEDNKNNALNENGEIDYIMNGERVCYYILGYGYSCPLEDLEESSEIIFDVLRDSEKTQSLERLMRYLLYLLTGDDYGVKEFDFEEFLNGSFSNVSGGIYGNTIQEKVWFAVLGAGYSKEAAAGVLGNIEAESGFNADLIEHGSGIGFGLCQWSFGRRTQLEQYAESKGKSPGDVNTQIEFLIAEITPGGGADGFANYQLMNYHGFSPSDWENATTPEDAAIAFCWTFERPGIPRMEVRTEAARRYYEELKDRERPTGGNFDVETVSAAGYTFPHYLQRNYDRAYGTNTIPAAGCGPTSLSMILAGLNGDSSINPITFVDNLEAYYPSYSSYYLPGAGSIYAGICNPNFLAQFYNCTSSLVGSVNQAYAALEAGKCIISREPGHVLAAIPVPDEYKSQGYKFYIMDSARGHDGPYKSVADAASVMGSFEFLYIIEPLG